MSPRPPCISHAGAVDALGQMAASEDGKLARQGCGALASILHLNIAGLAAAIAASGLPPLLLHHIQQAGDDSLRLEATRLLCEVRRFLCTCMPCASPFSDDLAQGLASITGNSQADVHALPDL